MQHLIKYCHRQKQATGVATVNFFLVSLLLFSKIGFLKYFYYFQSKFSSNQYFKLLLDNSIESIFTCGNAMPGQQANRFIGFLVKISLLLNTNEKTILPCKYLFSKIGFLKYFYYFQSTFSSNQYFKLLLNNSTESIIYLWE